MCFRRFERCSLVSCRTFLLRDTVNTESGLSLLLGGRPSQYEAAIILYMAQDFVLARVTLTAFFSEVGNRDFCFL